MVKYMVEYNDESACADSPGILSANHNSGNFQWSDFALDPGMGFVFGHAQFVKRLEIQPEFGAGPETARQTQRSVRGNAALTVHNFVQPGRSDPECRGKAIHAHAERHEVVFPDRFSRVRRFHHGGFDRGDPPGQ
jgi:hypothetical protein